MIIVIEGPEKSGKSTLAKALQSIKPMEIRHWGPVFPDDRVYKDQLIKDSRSEKWVIWDRCWPSEYVYGNLLKRDRRLSNDSWLGEWLYGRAIKSSGVGIIMLPLEVNKMVNLRDQSDLNVDPYEEVKLYRKYAIDYGWTICPNDYEWNFMDQTLAYVQKRMIEVGLWNLMKPPEIVGDPRSKIVFVGDKKGCVKDDLPGSWLPFTSSVSTKFFRLLGNRVFNCAWTFVKAVEDEYLDDKTIIACGAEAQKWCIKIRCNRIFSIPHPYILMQLINKQSVLSKNVVETLQNIM